MWRELETPSGCAVGAVDEAHRRWSFAEDECGRALREWFEAAPGRRATAYAAYRTTLAREEAAAAELAQLSRSRA